MCGRYTLTWPLDAMLAQLTFMPAPDFSWQPRYNIAPGGPVLALVRRDQQLFGGLMHWGFRPRWQSSSSRPLINARRETLTEKPTFRQASHSRRAVLLADGYYEWDQRTRQPYRITDPGHGLWFFAAIYQPRADGGAEVVIITTEAQSSVRSIHPRMPLILSADALDPWLDATSTAYQAILAMPVAPPVECYPVSRRVNSASAEGPGLIVPEPRD